MNKKELLRLVWDSYPSSIIGATFEDCFDSKKPEILKGDLEFLGDCLLAFLLHEVDDTVREERETIMLASALKTVNTIVDDVSAVQKVIAERLASIPKDSLIPPDLERCQAEYLAGSFMTMGPRHMERCSRKPDWVATEKQPGSDGQRGSMSLCEKCRKVFVEKHPGQATFKEIKRPVQKGRP